MFSCILFEIALNSIGVQAAVLDDGRIPVGSTPADFDKDTASPFKTDGAKKGPQPWSEIITTQ